MTWKTIDLSSIFPPTLGALISLSSTIVGGVNTVLETFIVVAEIVKLFIVDYTDPILAIVEAFIEQLENFFKDLKETGVYMLSTYPESLQDKQTFGSFLNGIAASSIDTSDPHRPQFSEDASIGGIVIMAGAESALDIADLMKTLGKIFNFEDMQRVAEIAKAQALGSGVINGCEVFTPTNQLLRITVGRYIYQYDINEFTLEQDFPIEDFTHDYYVAYGPGRSVTLSSEETHPSLVRAAKVVIDTEKEVIKEVIDLRVIVQEPERDEKEDQLSIGEPPNWYNYKLVEAVPPIGIIADEMDKLVAQLTTSAKASEEMHRMIDLLSLKIEQMQAISDSLADVQETLENLLSSGSFSVLYLSPEVGGVQGFMGRITAAGNAPFESGSEGFYGGITIMVGASGFAAFETIFGGLA